MGEGRRVLIDIRKTLLSSVGRRGHACLSHDGRQKGKGSLCRMIQCIEGIMED